MRALISRYSQWVCGMAMAAVILAAGTARGNDWRTDRFCAPTAFNWPAGLPTSSDGVVQGDLGYVRDYRFIFADGTHDQLAAVQAVKAADNSKLWMAFEVFNAHYNPNTKIVLAFDTGPGAAGNGPYKIFEITPMQGDGAGGAGHTPVSVQYYTQGAGPIAPTTWVAGAPPAGTVMGYAPSTDSSGHLGWQLEMELPVAGLGLPTTRDFGMYINTLAIVPGVTAAIEMRWPDGANPALPITGDITHLPQPGADTTNPHLGWGRMSLADNSCKGVYVESWNGDIYTSIDNPAGNNGTQLTYSTSKDNYFHARVHNDGPPASGVTASFKIANFGTSYDAWSPPVSLTGTTLTTTTAAQSIATDGAADYVIGPWRLVASQVTQYQNTHQCILVDLDSSVNGTAFRIKSGFTNADFNVASTVQTNAQINTKGLGPPPAGMANHRFAYYVKPAIQFAYSDGRHAEIPAHRIALQLGLAFHAYHYTGQTITLGKTRYDILESGPGFEVTYQHLLAEAFDKEFKARHAKLDEQAKRAVILKDHQGDGQRPNEALELYRQINAQLAVDPEKPKPEAWTQKYDGLTPVENAGGFWFKTEVPPTGVRDLLLTTTAVEGGDGGGGKGPICCMGGSPKTTPTAAAMLMVLGVWVHRRRRRDGERKE